ncbi:hypothetical protein HHK36_007303 [Tetracentron sinense]|uniref:Uncharacterized protein n=1 Tax=Tetracentron sinense TaxID=13715 RepID=A0A834ZJJ9_TETSI|nr:hypothetical protein HHK36_007303 [Tetracentron sinense]
MGAKVQCKSYLSGYYFMRDLNEDANSGSWPLYYEDKTLKSGHYHNGFLPRPALDEYLAYDKEVLKQTMLKHETIFRNQVLELHRLYRIQRDLMDEIKSKELHKHPLPVEKSQSSSFSSQMPSEDAQKTWHIPSLPLTNSVCSRLSISGADNIQSPLSFIKGKSIQAGPVPSQNGGSLKDCELLESKGKKLWRKMFDLQLPADEYIDGEERKQFEEEKVSGVSEVASYPPKINCEVAAESDLCLRRTLADLNEPIEVEEATASAFVDFLGPVTCHREIQGQDLSVKRNSGFRDMPTKFSQNTQKVMGNGSRSNILHLENEGSRQEWLSYNLEAGQSGGNLNSFPRSFCPEELPIPSEPFQIEPKKAHELPTFLLSEQSKKEPWRERSVFGFEISERSCDPSTYNYVGPVVASHIPKPYPPVPQSDVVNSESSLVSSWRKPISDLRQNLMAVQAVPCFNTSAPLIKSSKSLIPSPGLIEDKWNPNSNSRSNASFGGEVSYRNSFCHGSQLESKVLKVCFSSVGHDTLTCSNENSSTSEHFAHHGPTKYFKGSDCIDVKSVKDMNLSITPPNGFQNAVVTQEDLVIIDRERKHENSPGGLPWLRVKPLCNREPAKGRECSTQMESSFLQAYSQHFVNKIETQKGPSPSFIQNSTSSACVCDAESKRIGVGDCPSERKILGFTIFDKPQISKDQSSSLRSISISRYHPSEVEEVENSGKFQALDIDLARDPTSPDSGKQLTTEDLVVENGLNNLAGFGNHINLNSCSNEEVDPRPSVPRSVVKITTEIDLEAPVIPETEEGIPPQEESLENQLETPLKSSQHNTGDSQEELVRIAADTIVSISSFGVHNCLEDATSQPSEASTRDLLHWFAEIVSSCTVDLESEVGVVLRSKDGGDHEESSSDGIDYFESMTLKLTETKVEEYCCKPQLLENQKEEETSATLLPSRPWKGQARRRRQRRDFQRDILPGLASLSRHEVTEDLQMIGGLMKATGCHWQTGLARRNAARNGWARGRRWLCGPAPTIAVSKVCPPQGQNNSEMGLEERSLAGWGKTTRRPRRQRCPAGNPPL